MSDLLERIKKNRKKRQEMLNRFGFIPLSVLSIKSRNLASKLYSFQHENPKHSRSSLVLHHQTDLTGYNNEEKAELKRYPINKEYGGKGQTRFSAMPPELVEFFIDYYCKPGQVYLDPFMGQGTQMQMAKRFGMHYYGYDLSSLFFPFIEKVSQKIDDGKTTIQVTLGDSRFPTEIPDGIGDFSFYSPPYWDFEFYGEEKGQLGWNQSYPEFLEDFRQIVAAWTPKFKTGAYQIINVNDFRRDGCFYSFHSDVIDLVSNCGWVQIDIWIVTDILARLPKAFAVNKNESKIAPKVHEYALVFRRL